MDTALDTYDSDPEQQGPADAARPSIAAASADPSLDASDLNSSGSAPALAPSTAGAKRSQAWADCTWQSTRALIILQLAFCLLPAPLSALHGREYWSMAGMMSIARSLQSASAAQAG